jgi:hypothetical protein
MTAILASGIPVTRNEVCDWKGHGSFLRHGWLWGNWLAWRGVREIYSSGFSEDAGCPGCQADSAESRKKRPGDWDLPPIRRFEARSAATCADHGNFLYEARLYENSEEHEKLAGSRYSVSAEMCSGCESDWVDGSELCGTFGLSNEDWARAGEALLGALHYARGWIDSSLFLSALENRIIPDVRRKCAIEPCGRADDAEAGEALLGALHYARGWIDSSLFLSALENRIIPDVRRKCAIEPCGRADDADSRNNVAERHGVEALA